jgi:hypothetical protein
MSLDMTMATREAVLETDEEIEAAAPVSPVWLQDVFMVACTAFAVLFNSVLGVILFLR